jgi:hypothetical protein
VSIYSDENPGYILEMGLALNRASAGDTSILFLDSSTSTRSL